MVFSIPAIPKEWNQTHMHASPGSELNSDEYVKVTDVFVCTHGSNKYCVHSTYDFHVRTIDTGRIVNQSKPKFIPK